MSKLNLQPPDLNQCKSYEAYKRELEAWAEVTDLAKNKQGNYVVLSLPNKSQYGDDLKERAFENISADNLKSETGLEEVKKFLDQELGKNAIDDAIGKWEEFDSCRRTESQTLEEFISDFETKYNRIKSSGTKLPEEILAFMLLKRSGITQVEKTLVLSRLNLEDKDNLFRNVKLHMKNILGKRLQDQKKGPADSIKLEPSFLIENEHVLAAHGFYRKRANTAPSQKNNYKGSKKSFPSKQDYQQKTDKSGRKVNPLGRDGKPMLCKSCGSYRHFVEKCPDSHERSSGVYLTSQAQDEATSSEEEPDPDRFVLFTANHDDLSRFTSEAINSAALDTGCTTSVTGVNWLKIYLESLPASCSKLVQGPLPSEKWFKFGNEGMLKSKYKYVLPAEIGNNSVMIEVDIIDSDIPLLLSKEAMKKAKMKIDLEDDTAIVLGQRITLNTTSAGHYVIPLLTKTDGINICEDQVFHLEDLLSVDLIGAQTSEQSKALDKLHKQFGHRPKASFINLLKSAGVWKPEMSQLIDKIIDNCEGCIKRKRNPDRPAVSMPMASSFNEKVAIDLSFYSGKIILHMIDMWSRLTVSVELKRKAPSEVIEAIMEKWIAYFGTMGTILNDNGGEFTSQEIQEVKAMLNIVDLTTGAESPWQNGLCEKNHALVDNILERLDEDYPDLSFKAKLAWAGMAKNSLQMVYGYSPNQLVFGMNPNLPNVLTDCPPALEETTSSEALAKHLNLLHASRKAFIKSEACTKIKAALKAKIRTSEEAYENGDIVYYRRAKDGRWMGPSKVVFQDGKIIFLRSGSSLIRVSANRLVKAGSELAKEIRQSESVATETDTNARLDPPSEDLCVQAGQQGSCSQDDQDPDQHMDTGTQITQDVQRNNENAKGSKINLKVKDRIRVKDGDNWVDSTITGRCKVTGKYKNYFNIARDDGIAQNVNLEDVEYEKLENPSPQAESCLALMPNHGHNTPECLEAKQTELSKLKEFDTYDEVEDIGQNSISCRWVLTQKGEDVRARLVARGFEEEENIQSDSPTLSKAGFRVILAVIASCGWNIETTDIKSAFLQGTQLQRDVYLKPPKEAGCRGTLWKLKKGLYGLKDAGRQWFFRVKEKLLHLGCEQSMMDPGLFTKKDEAGTIIGLIGLHVDDFLHAGSQTFNETVIQEIHNEFLVGKNEKGSFTYTGFAIKQKDHQVILDQNSYTQGVEVPVLDPKRSVMKHDDLNDTEKSQLRTLAGTLNWAVRGTRPDLNFELIDISTKFKSGKVDDLVRAVKVVRSLQNKKAEIVFPDLGHPSNWLLLCFTDAALGNLNNGIDSTGGHILLLANRFSGRCAALDWQSNKIKRVVKSTLAAEALSLVDGLENSVFITDLLKSCCPTMVDIPIIAIVDNLSVVEAVHSTTAVGDKRLRREVGAIKEMLGRREIAAVKWVPGSQQLADSLTKRGVNGDKILGAVQTGEYDPMLLNHLSNS